MTEHEFHEMNVSELWGTWKTCSTQLPWLWRAYLPHSHPSTAPSSALYISITVFIFILFPHHLNSCFLPPFSPLFISHLESELILIWSEIKVPHFPALLHDPKRQGHLYYSPKDGISMKPCLSSFCSKKASRSITFFHWSGIFLTNEI